MSEGRRIAEGMSRAFKRRVRVCPVCGRRTVQRRLRSWEPYIFRCAFQRFHRRTVCSHGCASPCYAHPNDEGAR